MKLADVAKLLPLFATSPYPERPTNFGLRKAGDSFLVETGGVWHLIWDNGGEIGVEVLNSGKLPRFVAAPALRYSALDHVHAAEAADRVAAVLRGDEIDYDTKWTEEEAGILEMTSH